MQLPGVFIIRPVQGDGIVKGSFNVHILHFTAFSSSYNLVISMQNSPERHNWNILLLLYCSVVCSVWCRVVSAMDTIIIVK